MQLVPGKNCCASTRELSSRQARPCAITELASKGIVFPVGSPLIVCICAKVSQTKKEQRSFQEEMQQSALTPPFPPHNLLVRARDEVNSADAEAVRNKERGEMSGPEGQCSHLLAHLSSSKCKAAATQTRD